ncbi:uncharacterized protein LOC135711979 [Ochlerotatus camptorhynchus]|uniref:uncharacterized protein LOC135711979 n=1 Tax=Ochlerotatus camptorhynchus TaxID=644619 RepID=UPI0031E38322
MEGDAQAIRPKSKSTTKNQYSTMVDLLEDHPDIARGFSRSDTGAFWKNLAEDLNSLGGPEKDPAAWKKVWFDWKSNLKRKLAHNRREQRATGGGPNKIVASLEERVVALTGLTAAVDGIEDSIAFGAPAAAHENNSGVANCSFVGHDPVDELSEVELQQEPIRRRQPGQRSLRLLETQVEQQQNFHQDLLGVLKIQAKKLDDMAHYNKQISKRMTEIQAAQAQQLQEQRRHNLEMEKIHLEKLKTKKEILALKLQHMQI